MGLNDDEGLTRITPHSFRYTVASWLVQAGVSLLKVSKLLGHADLKMTEKYAHMDPEANGRDAVAVLDRMDAMKVAEGDDPKPTPSVMKVLEGDDPKSVAEVMNMPEGDDPKGSRLPSMPTIHP